MRRLWRGDGTSVQGAHYRLERPSGYLRVDPAPPIVVGGFGPRMAAIAGRHADGFNTQARHPNLAGVLRIGLLGRTQQLHIQSKPAGFIGSVVGIGQALAVAGATAPDDPNPCFPGPCIRIEEVWENR